MKPVPANLLTAAERKAFWAWLQKHDPAQAEALQNPVVAAARQQLGAVVMFDAEQIAAAFPGGLERQRNPGRFRR